MDKNTLYCNKDMIELIETNDIEYIVNLSYEESKHEFTKEQIRSVFDISEYYFWLLNKNGIIGGVAGFIIIDGFYILEALRDRSTKDWTLRDSLYVGEIVINKIFEVSDRARTFARVNDRAIQILCKKLKFKELFIKDGFIIYERERLICQ